METFEDAVRDACKNLQNMSRDIVEYHNMRSLGLTTKLVTMAFSLWMPPSAPTDSLMEGRRVFSNFLGRLPDEMRPRDEKENDCYWAGSIPIFIRQVMDRATIENFGGDRTKAMAVRELTVKIMDEADKYFDDNCRGGPGGKRFMGAAMYDRDHHPGGWVATRDSAVAEARALRKRTSPRHSSFFDALGRNSGSDGFNLAPDHPASPRDALGVGFIFAVSLTPMDWLIGLLATYPELSEVH
jgi:hypothetical protein